jgi:hypothetical protein
LHLGHRFPNFVHRHMVEQPVPVHQRCGHFTIWKQFKRLSD